MSGVESNSRDCPYIYSSFALDQRHGMKPSMGIQVYSASPCKIRLGDGGSSFAHFEPHEYLLQIAYVETDLNVLQLCTGE